MSTMDDETQRTLKIKINGTEYAAAPFEQAQVMALQMVRSVQSTTVIKILAGLVKFSLGEEAQAEVLVMLAEGDINEKDLIQILMDVAKATAEEKEDHQRTVEDIAKGVSAPPMQYGGDDA